MLLDCCGIALPRLGTLDGVPVIYRWHREYVLVQNLQRLIWTSVTRLNASDFMVPSIMFTGVKVQKTAISRLVLCSRFLAQGLISGLMCQTAGA